MLSTDFILFSSLTVFAVLWLMPGHRHGHVWLWILPVTALVSGSVSVMRLHWQSAGGALLAVLLLVFLALLRLFSSTDRWRRRRPRIVVGGLILALIGLATLPLYFVPLFAMPKPSGPYSVGTRQFELTDPSRNDASDASGSDPRRLQIRVWYPAGSTEGFEARRYFSGTDLPEHAMSVAENFGLPRFFFLHLALVRTHSFEGAPVARDQAFPVVIFNHGFSSYAAQNTVLMEHLASHGYMIFSVAHPVDGAAVKFDDGTIVRPIRDRDNGAPFMEALQSFVAGGTHEVRYAGLNRMRERIGAIWLPSSIEAWRDDNIFLAQSLKGAKHDQTIAELTAQADFGKVAYAGMSFGGATAATVCQVDPLCKAAVDLDGFNWDMSLYDRSLRVPLLYLQSDWTIYPSFQFPRTEPNDPNFSPNDYAYEAWKHAGDRSDIHRFRLSQLAHGGLSDLVLIVRPPLRDRICGHVEATRALGMINDLTLAFLERYVRGENMDFPREILTRYPEAITHDASGVKYWWRSREEAGGS